MVQTTRTLHPLPFEHLEPKRFEDLIRQLAYEFRTWRMLEATGRSGADGGYDIRGWEIRPHSEEAPEADEEPVGEPDQPADRRWLIQCKREQRITPKKMGDHFDAIPQEELKDLYGLVMAVSCNLSKRARDTLLERCRQAGIAECHVWTQAEIEDMLFQPRNDGLLFAYFGISLRIRQRAVRSELRARLAAKRKAIRALGEADECHEHVVVRDPEEDRYPYLESGVDRDEHLWRVMTFRGHHPLGMKFLLKRCFAYLRDDGAWDIANRLNDAVQDYFDPWSNDDAETLRKEVLGFWNGTDATERAWFELEVIVPYEELIDIDQHGDEMTHHAPHLYFSFDADGQIPSRWSLATVEVPPVREKSDEGRYEETHAKRSRILDSPSQDRVPYFPDKFRLPAPGEK